MLKNKTNAQKLWVSRFQSHLENCRLALEDMDELEETYENNPDVLEFLQPIRKTMEQIKRGADDLYEEIVTLPIHTMFSLGRLKLTEEQYLLARAAGFDFITAKSLGISPVDDYEVFKNCVYEDLESVGFMDPNETPEVETKDEKTGVTHIRIRIACSPEETFIEKYRPEQIRFFEKFRPDVLTRAQKTEKKQLKSAETSRTNNS